MIIEVMPVEKQDAGVIFGESLPSGLILENIGEASGEED
jgi:hypothetical protein